MSLGLLLLYSSLQIHLEVSASGLALFLFGGQNTHPVSPPASQVLQVASQSAQNEPPPEIDCKYLPSSKHEFVISQVVLSLAEAVIHSHLPFTG